MKKNTKKGKFLLIMVFFFFLFLAVSPLSAGAAGIVPCGGTSEPKCSLCHLIIGIDNIIDFGFKILIGVALLGIMVAGIMYIVSTGNDQAMGKAKEMLKQILTGFVIVIGAWLLINTAMWVLGSSGDLGIGVDGWSEFSCDTTVAVIDGEGDDAYSIICGDGACGTAETCTSCKADCGECPPTGPTSDTCAKYPNTNNIIDFSTTTKTTLPSGCSTYESDFQSVSTSSGVDIKILKAIAAIESTCGVNLVGYDGLSCGIMHLRMSTAGKDCDWLKSHPKESIEMAAQYIASNSGKHGGNMEKIFAGYNGGFGATTSDGKLGAFANSHDCPGALAYQCCKNPGGLAGAQDYVFKGIKYYNYQ